MTNRLLLVIMDGVGERQEDFGNAVKLAKTPNLANLRSTALCRTIFAHGTYVGMPSDADLGNSEVGHNAMGAGRIFDQGAKLVSQAISSGRLFEGKTWNELIDNIEQHESTLHFIGLLSDGNVHSHEQHLYSMLQKAVAQGAKRIRLHILLDGRDVSEGSAEVYLGRLQNVMDQLITKGADIAIASGGGRMRVTMDRYEADWEIVERGWKAHVLGESDYRAASAAEAIKHFRAEGHTDQYFPAFVLTDPSGKPVGRIEDNDSVILTNFRGDRAIEICRAFEEDHFDKFSRRKKPNVMFAGMMEYDGDLHIPSRFLVDPPIIENTVSAHLASLGIRQWVCSETQKFGHVTYFWNGNRTGKFDPKTEEYIEIASDRINFDQKPEMKAREIANAAIAAITAKSADFYRLNFANGDMVGHTGHLKAAIQSVETVDLEVGRLMKTCQDNDTVLIVTADHGNCEEMFDAKKRDYPDWRFDTLPQPKPKTAHTLNPVPIFVLLPSRLKAKFTLAPDLETGGLANIANTVLTLLGLPVSKQYLPSLVDAKK